MKLRLDSRTDYRRRRHLRLRKKISGTPECPRMSVMVSNRHMYVQFIDDDSSTTLAGVSNIKDAGVNNVKAARELGRRAAAAAAEKGIAEAVFDRGGFAFRGRIRAIADGAVSAGLRIGGTVAIGDDASGDRTATPSGDGKKEK